MTRKIHVGSTNTLIHEPYGAGGASLGQLCHYTGLSTTEFKTQHYVSVKPAGIALPTPLTITAPITFTQVDMPSLTYAVKNGSLSWTDGPAIVYIGATALNATIGFGLVCYHNNASSRVISVALALNGQAILNETLEEELAQNIRFSFNNVTTMGLVLGDELTLLVKVPAGDVVVETVWMHALGMEQ